MAKADKIKLAVFGTITIVAILVIVIYAISSSLSSRSITTYSELGKSQYGVDASEMFDREAGQTYYVLAFDSRKVDTFAMSELKPILFSWLDVVERNKDKENPAAKKLFFLDVSRKDNAGCISDKNYIIGVEKFSDLKLDAAQLPIWMEVHVENETDVFVHTFETNVGLIKKHIQDRLIGSVE